MNRIKSKYKRLVIMLLAALLSISMAGIAKEPDFIQEYEVFSIADLYAERDATAFAQTNEIKLLNIDKTAKFAMHFNSYVDPNQVYGIYTDESCNQESWLYTPSETYYTANENGDSTGIDIIIYPPEEPVLNADNIKWQNWGNASTLYLKIYYDREAVRPTVLDTPEIYALSFASNVDAVTGDLDITQDGLLSLSYEAGNDCTAIDVYNIPLINQNETVTEASFIGTISHLFTIDVDKEAKQKEYVFDSKNFIKKLNNYVICQNNYNIDSLFLRPKTENALGNFSEEISTKVIKSYLPVKLSNATQAKFSQVMEELPSEAGVQMMDNSIRSYKINYKLLDKSHYKKERYVWYEYSIPGTLLTGKVQYKPENGEYKDEVINIVPEKFKSDYVKDVIQEKRYREYYITEEDYIDEYYNKNSRLYYDPVDMQNLKNLIKNKQISGVCEVNPVALPVLNYMDKYNNLSNREKQLGDIYTEQTPNVDDLADTEEIIEMFGYKFKDTYDYEQAILNNGVIDKILLIP